MGNTCQSLINARRAVVDPLMTDKRTCSKEERRKGGRKSRVPVRAGSPVPR